MTALLRLLVFCVLVASSFGLSRESHAGVKGWCTALVSQPGALACAGDPMAACVIQWQDFSPNSNPFLGIRGGGRPGEKWCDWYGYVFPNNYPGYVALYCDDYSSVDSPDQCFSDNVASRAPKEKEKEKDSPCSVGSVNGGGTPSVRTSGPIEILNGAKLFRAQDFRTADGSLVLERLYNSRTNIGARTWIFGAIVREPLGSGRLWRLSFQHELFIGGWFGSFGNIELATSDGGVYAFQRNSSGGMDPVAPSPGISRQTDYRVEFVGTWPSNIGDVLTSSSQWRVTDPEDGVWLFETYQDASTGYYRSAIPVSVTFRNGLQWTFSYGTYRQLTSITDSFGKTLSFNWNIRDFAAVGGTGAEPIGISSVTLPDTTVIKYIYDTVWTTITGIDQADRLIKVEHRDASNNLLDATEYLHESTVDPYFVTGIKDSAGTRRWTVEYDSSRRAITSKGPSDVDKTTVSYTAIQYPSFTRTVTNALGKETVYSYQYNFGPVSLQSIDGNASTNCPASSQAFSYSSDFLTSATDAEGRVTQWTRDSNGRETQRIDGYGTGSARTVSTTWHSTLNVPTQIVQPGLTTDLTWTSGRLTSVTQTDTTAHTVPYSTNGQTRSWAYTYGTYGQLLTMDGPLSGTGDTVTYTYDSNGYVATITNEVGHVTTVNSVNGRGQPTSITDPNSVVTTLTYDSEGRIKTVTVDPSGSAALTTIDYNVVGDMTKITRPNGVYLQYTYDAGRRLTKIEDNTGASIELDRNNLGNNTAVRIKDPSSTLKLSQTATFDELGRMLAFVGASSQTWTSAYDKTDNLKSVTDPRSNTSQWSFDPVNRLISATDEASNTVTLTRNGKDEITNYADPRSLSTAYVRNGFGDVIQRTSPDTGTTVYTVNALGKPTQITDGRSIVTNLTYDNAGRILTREYPAATSENITYTWDSVVSGNKGKGRVTKLEDASGSIEWTYNVLGQVAQEKKTTASVVYTVDYTYDLDGNITQAIYPSGRIVSYSRDSVGRISGVTTKKDSGSSIVTLASSVAYQSFGSVQSLTYGNGLALAKTFTSDYNPDTLAVNDSSTPLASWTYGYANGDFNITAIADAVTSSRTEAYVYTANNRLQEIYGSWGDLAYTQDGVGNRTQEVFDNGSSTTTKDLSYPSTNNLVGGVTQGAMTLRAMTHDGAGNIITDDRGGTVYNYRYNKRGRLDRLTVGSTVTADHTYDGLERMAMRATQNMTPASTTHYIYDRAGRLIAEASNSGAALREYIWLDDMPLAVVADIDTMTPKLWYVHSDHLNRPTRMTDGSKAIVWNAYYWPYGEVRSISGSASLDLRFPGQYFLVESGLHYNWHRHFDPTTGRYIQPDPLGFIDGPSLYAYAKSSPALNVDPTGQYGWQGAAGGALFNFLIQFGINLAVLGHENGMSWESAFLAAQCVDYFDVAASGAIGAAGPAFLTNVLAGWVVNPGRYGSLLNAAQNRSVYASVSYPGGLLIKKFASWKFGDKCECKGLELGPLVGSLLH